MTQLTKLKMPIIITYVGRFIKKRHRHIKRQFKYKFKKQTVEIKTKTGNFKIITDPIHNGCVDEGITQNRLWEPEVSTCLTRHISRNGVFIDIGANIGYHSLYIASYLDNTGEVHAFEPISRLHAQIKHSVSVNKFTNVTVHGCALGDTTSKITIHLRDENMGGSSINKYSNLNLVRTSGEELIEVKTLDSVFPSNKKVDLIKIDVEGYEYEVLLGASQLLKSQHPSILMEFSPIFYKEENEEKTKEIIVYLESFGYSFYDLNEHPIDLRHWLSSTSNPSQIDIICKFNQ